MQSETIHGRWLAHTCEYQSSPDGDADFEIYDVPAEPGEAFFVFEPLKQCVFERGGIVREGTYAVDGNLISIVLPEVTPWEKQSHTVKIHGDELRWMDRDEEHDCDVLLSFSRVDLGQESDEEMAVPRHVALGPARDDDGCNWDDTTHLAAGKELFRYLDDGSLYISSSATPEQLAAVVATGFLDGMTSLHIDTHSKKVVSLPANISRMSKLTHVSIDSSKFAGWEQLYQLTSLTSLHLGPATGGALPDLRDPLNSPGAEREGLLEGIS